jgi:cell wall-associated NlpC family hydrolase
MSAIIPPASARVRFVAAVESKLGAPVVWAAKGDEAFDCSGLFTWALMKAGGPDIRHTENAQGLFNLTRALGPGELPLHGDAVFYGADEKSIIHIAVYRGDGSIISADGATSHITSLAVAMANPANRVRIHKSVLCRNERLITVRRNSLVDALDGVTR